jgi:sugar phosphate isomerase/epimerase
MILGAQLYTLRNEMKTPEEIDIGLKAVAEMGYTTVQVSGIGKIDAGLLREICDKYKLQIVITHISADRLLFDTQNVIEEHKILGCSLVGIGSMPDKYRGSVKGCEQFISDYKPIAEQFALSGMTFMYHNHNFELEHFNGKTILEMLAKGFDKDIMGFTLDTYWIQNAGGDPEEYLEYLTGRVPAVHLKDMVYSNHEVIMAPVGEGNMNWQRITKACEKAGTKFLLVEQDTCIENPFICLKKSFDNLSRLGYK